MNRVVVVKASDAAGLGDRLRALASALGYAELTGRAIYIDWRDGMYAPLGTNAFSYLFQLCGPVHEALWQDWSTVAPPAWQGALDRTFSERVAERASLDPWDRERAHHVYAIDPGNLDYSEQAVVIWDYEQLGRMAEPLKTLLGLPEAAGELELLGALLRRHLRPTAAVEALGNPIDALPDGGPRLGLHVRWTREGRDRQIPLAWCADVVRLSRLVRRATVYLATDNREVEACLRPLGRVCTQAKWFPEPGLAMHLAEGCCPDRVQNGRMAAAELIALARCDLLIYPAASSFSTVAAAWSGLPANRLFPLVALGEPCENMPCRVRRLVNRWRFGFTIVRGLLRSADSGGSQSRVFRRPCRF